MDPLAEPQDLATYLRQDVDTAAAQLFLAAASAAIRDYCRWPITAFTDTATLQTTGERVVMLPCLFVTAINSVTLDGVTLTEDDDYTWSPMGAVKRKHHPRTLPSFVTDWPRYPHGWPTGYQRLKVDYDGGYTDIPPELTVAACSMAARNMVQPGITQLTETVGGVTTNVQYRTVAQNMRLLGSEQIMIDRYRIPLAA